MRARHLALLLLASGCADQAQPLGIDEPIYVEGSSFRRGALPSSEDDASGPKVTNVELPTTIFFPEQLGPTITGRVTEDAYALALRVAGEGHGYFVREVDGSDPLYGGERAFQVDFSVSGLAPGWHDLRFAATDANGIGGPPRDVAICVRSELPDNLNACDATRKPPATIVALAFGQDVDLDLSLVGPGDEIVDSKRPVGDGPGPVTPEALADPAVPRFDRDSNSACTIDGLRREHVYFTEDPAAGEWEVYADLFDACGEPAVTFTLEIYRRADHGDGTYSLDLDDRISGQLVASQANGGAGPSLHLTTLRFP